MTSPRFAGRRRDFETSVTCSACGKVGYMDKRQARKKIRQMEHREGRLNVYRCPVQQDFFHIGHLPPDVTAGEVARADLKPRNPNKRRRTYP